MYQVSKAKLGQPVANTLSHPLIVYRTADLCSKGNIESINEPCGVVRCTGEGGGRGQWVWPVKGRSMLGAECPHWPHYLN